MSRRTKIAVTVAVICLPILIVFRLNPRITPYSTVIQKASAYGIYPVVAVQLLLGVDPDGPDRTPLIEAIMNNHPAVAQLLVIGGANLERRFASGEPNGPPLMWALQNGRCDIAKMLLRHGASAVARVSYPLCNTAYLQMAVKANDPELVALLIQKKADANFVDGAGVTPLHVAAAYGRVESARILLQSGAQRNPRTTLVARESYAPNIPAGSTPIGLAVARGDKEMVQLLSSR